MNVNLIDVSPESGSTELWLGTNNDSPPTDWIEPGVSHINPALLEPRRAIRPPLQPTVKKGGVVLRDLRLWHAGVPNPSDDIRVMIVLLHFAQWFGNGEYIQMPRSLQPAIEATSDRAGNKFICQWIEDKNWNYLDSRFAQDFSSKVHPEFWEPYREASEVKLAKMNM